MRLTSERSESRSYIHKRMAATSGSIYIHSIRVCQGKTSGKNVVPVGGWNYQTEREPRQEVGIVLSQQRKTRGEMIRSLKVIYSTPYHHLYNNVSFHSQPSTMPFHLTPIDDIHTVTSCHPYIDHFHHMRMPP